MAKSKRTKTKKTKMKMITFETDKYSFYNKIDALSAQDKLYKTSAMEDVIQRLNDNDIHITPQEIVDQYKGCYNIEKVIKDYEGKNRDKLGKIEEKGQLFDSSCIVYYVDKVIRENFDPYHIPDPHYIFNACIDIGEMLYKKRVEVFIEMLKSVNELKKYYTSHSLGELFEQYNFDFCEYVAQFLFSRQKNIKLDDAKIIADELIEIMDYYGADDMEFAYGFSLKALSQYGYDAVEKYLEIGMKKLPECPLQLCYDVLLGLEEYTKTTHQRNDFIKLYEKATKIKPQNDDEEFFLADIKDMYKLN